MMEPIDLLKVSLERLQTEKQLCDNEPYFDLLTSQIEKYERAIRLIYMDNLNE